MKKILIVNNNMHIGGVQKALVSLISGIKDRYDVTLLLFNPAGEYMSSIPEGVRIISLSSGYRYLGMVKNDAKTRTERLMRAFYAGITRLFGRGMALSLMGMGQKRIGKYDVAISYLHNGGEKVFYGGCNDFVLSHVDADKKIAVLHCDYSNFNTSQNEKKYKQFDLVAGCSDGCKAAFVKCLPELTHKTVTLRNHHEFEKIRSLSENAPVELSEEYINIVTVARLGREKGVHRAIEAINGLGELKSRIKYYIIGDGVERSRIESLIEQYGLKDTVTLCGELSNPYGYMKAADILMLSSYSEAAPLVIGEAACLGTPILSTKTSSAIEMIVETGYGWVCENSVESLTELIRDVVAFPERIMERKKYLTALRHSNDIADREFDSIINDQRISKSEQGT